MIATVWLVSLAAQTQPALPAFLDASDSVTIWLPEPSRPERISQAATITIDGQSVAINGVEGREAPSFQSSPDQVVLPGTIQSALGGGEWDPNGQITKMTETAPGIFEFIAEFPAGNYEYKVAMGGSWEKNWGANFAPGGGNITLSIAKNGTIVRFIVDFNKSTIKDSINQPTEIKAPSTVPIRPQNQNPTGSFSSFSIKLQKPVTDLKAKIEVNLDGETRRVYPRYILNQSEYTYTGSDLGPTYSPAKTQFKVWAPTATRVDLVSFKAGTDQISTSVPLTASTQGTWQTSIAGDLNGMYYAYKLTFPSGESTLAADIYAKSASPDSTQSQVIDLNKTNPKTWMNRTTIKTKSPLDAIIYEFHIRDFTISESSGVDRNLRGKYLGVVQPNTTFQNQPTGIDYLKWLGVTHVHLLPFQNYNPDHSDQYNWGYETTLFNVPEEQYSTNKNNPSQTILETKTMITELQKQGIGVVLDVVYNHSVPSQGDRSAFWATVPYYYFRTNDRGDVLNESGVGNALNDENPMVRKFIRDSLTYWADEYNLDGFRFDLLGMFTPETVADLAQAIRTVNPDALIYGEPWTGGGPNRSPKGSLKGLNVAVFNDTFRNLLKGGLDDGRPGFIDGNPTDPQEFASVLTGSTRLFAAQPTETINYITAHDNLSLWDAITASQPQNSLELHKSSLRLATATVLLAQGIPFLEGGAEIGRTKGGNHNSYNAGDMVNQFDWQRALDFQDTAEYTRQLIELRKTHPAFRIRTKNEIEQAITPIPWTELPSGTIGFHINGALVKDSWKSIHIIFNPSAEPKTMNLPSGNHRLIAHGSQINLKGIKTVKNVTTLAPVSVTILAQP